MAWAVTIDTLFADSHLDATSVQADEVRPLTVQQTQRPHHPHLHIGGHWDSWFLEPTNKPLMSLKTLADTSQWQLRNHLKPLTYSSTFQLLFNRVMWSPSWALSTMS